MFEEHDIDADAARHWWIFLLTGIAWLVFALVLFQWDYTTVYAISILFGVVGDLRGSERVRQMAVSTRAGRSSAPSSASSSIGAGIWAIIHPHAAFTTLAALVGFFFLVKGTSISPSPS